LFRTSLYKESLKSLKGKWIGLRFNPPLLLQPSPLVDLNREKDKKEWEEVERTMGFYEQGAITRYIAWDIR
jgi:hypothetical protein